jgi:hypothetical protein
VAHKAQSKTELAVRSESALGAPKEEWFDPSAPVERRDRTITYAQLVQKTSGSRDSGVGEVGDIVTTTGKNYGKRVVIIPLWFQKSAVRFVQGEDKPECKSNDGITGSKYGPCKGCPHFYGNFKELPDGTWERPECSYRPTFVSLVLDSESHGDEEKSVAAFAFYGTSMKVAKKINTEKEDRKLPYYASKWEITTRVKPFAKGPAAIYDARYLGRNDPELMRQLENATRELHDVPLEEVVSDDFHEVEESPPF